MMADFTLESTLEFALPGGDSFPIDADDCALLRPDSDSILYKLSDGPTFIRERHVTR